MAQGTEGKEREEENRGQSRFQSRANVRGEERASVKEGKESWLAESRME